MKELFKRSRAVEVSEESWGYTITITKKSRFLQKDARLLMDKISDYDFKTIKIVITGPLCSKARILLEDSGLAIDS